MTLWLGAGPADHEWVGGGGEYMYMCVCIHLINLRWWENAERGWM